MATKYTLIGKTTRSKAKPRYTITTGLFSEDIIKTGSKSRVISLFSMAMSMSVIVWETSLMAKGH